MIVALGTARNFPRLVDLAGDGDPRKVTVAEALRQAALDKIPAVTSEPGWDGRAG